MIILFLEGIFQRTQNKLLLAYPSNMKHGTFNALFIFNDE